MLSDRDQLMRKIGLAQKIFTRAQWDEAAVRAEPRGESVGEALLAKGVITRETWKGLERAVLYREGRDEDKELAHVIVTSGYAQEPAVETAFTKQKDIYAKTGELVRLCALLVDEGTLTESQHLAARKIREIATRSLPRRPVANDAGD